MGRTARVVRRTGALVALLATAAFGLAPPTPAGAAGETTHAWMARNAIDEVTSPALHDLLVANAPYLRAGAHFPDSGYVLTNRYGEEAHWQRYVDALVARIRGRADCPDLTAVDGPCAALVAFTMGIAAHGMGDEVWDWLFEPNVADLGEYYTPDYAGGFANEGGAELQLDLEAVGGRGEPTTPLVAFPDRTDLIAAYAAVDFHDVDDEQLNLGQTAMEVLHGAEASWANDHLAELRTAMPWASHNVVTAPGGVDFAATAIAGYLDNTWGQLLGAQPATEVSITYPADGDRRIPAAGWERTHEPGSARGRGGARTRIAAALTYARPYVALASGGTPVSAQLPAGAMTLAERASGTPVAIAAGYPKSVPYGPDAGEHLVDIQPAADLTPCTWYRVAVTDALLDAHGAAVTPTTWDFRTGTDADGHRCADDPYTPDERFVRQATADLLDRPATDAELQAATDAFDRWGRRSTLVTGVLASAEERGRLVTDAFQHDLGRAPDPSGLAYWAGKLRTISIPELHARLLGSPEVYRGAGSTNAGYVAALYPLVHGRAADPSGAAYWTGRLDRGLSRTSLARMLLLSHESARRTVGQAFDDLLDRPADPSGLTHWTKVLERGADPRDLWRALILSPEYDRRAQAA